MKEALQNTTGVPDHGLQCYTGKGIGCSESRDQHTGDRLIVFIAVSSISFAGVIVLLYERHRKS